MRLIESAMGGGLVVVGAVLLGAGRLISMRVITLGGYDTPTISAQLGDMGFILVTAGFLVWLVAYVLGRIRAA